MRSAAPAVVALTSAPAPCSRREHRWDLLRWSLLGLWAATTATAALVGQHPADLGDLDVAVAQRRTTAVAVSPGLPEGASGWATQDVVWRDGLLAHRAHVHLDVPGRGAVLTEGGGDAPRDGVPVLEGVHDVGAQLAARHPGLAVRHLDDDGLRTTPFGWTCPAWLLAPMLLGGLAAVAHLRRGPAPWWATRWAWAWLLLAGGLVVAPALLALAGPTPPLPQRPAGRRLTGGWALLLAVVVLAPLTAAHVT